MKYINYIEKYLIFDIKINKNYKNKCKILIMNLLKNKIINILIYL